MDAQLEIHDRVLRGAIESHGGFVFATGGDSFSAAFSSPTSALTAAVGAQRGLIDSGCELQVRMGVHSGEAVERDGNYFGPPLNRTARLMSIGHGGQILVSATARAGSGCTSKWRRWYRFRPTSSASVSRHQPGAGTLITFLGLTGLRWGEAVALRRSSLDLLRRRVNVKESTTEVGGRLVTGRPKNHRVRTVILPRTIVDTLAVHLSPGGVDDLAFTSPRGGALRHSNFRKTVWLPAVAELATRYPELAGLRPHDLRHTAASLAISCNANIKVVQRMLGHKTASITLDRYGHLYTEDLETWPTDWTRSIEMQPDLVRPQFGPYADR